MSTVTVARTGFPIPLEQAPQAVELMVERLLHGLKCLDTIINRPVGVPNRERTETVYVCCGNPGDCTQPCNKRYEYWYRTGPRRMDRPRDVVDVGVFMLKGLQCR